MAEILFSMKCQSTAIFFFLLFSGFSQHLRLPFHVPFTRVSPPGFLSSYPIHSWDCASTILLSTCPSSLLLTCPYHLLFYLCSSWSQLPLLLIISQFVSCFIYIRDSTHPSHHHHLVHLQAPFLAFRCCPCLCTVHHCCPYHCFPVHWSEKPERFPSTA